MFVERSWSPTEAGIGVPRRLRQAGRYRAYVPDPLLGRTWQLATDTFADVADAERAIAVLDAQARVLPNTEGIARLLLRAEALGSSQIEGLVVSPQRLLRYAASLEEGRGRKDDTAAKVLANVDAIIRAVDAALDEPITVAHILEVHRKLLGPTELSRHAGTFRLEQNWIGSAQSTPLTAVYVPPPPEHVPELMIDLCAFCNDESLPVVAQAAIAHLQFETIHPFVDGNGRVGRALIQMIFKRRGLATRTLPPVSLTLATQSHDYIRALQSLQGAIGNTNAELNEWVSFFAAACIRAVNDARIVEERIGELFSRWDYALADVRVDATSKRLLNGLLDLPVLTVRLVERRLDVSYNAANTAIETLVAAGILTQSTHGRRHRVFEATELLATFALLERRLASPAGDTVVSPPIRPVPTRPQKKKLQPME